ncbi:hypothetical protein QWY84_19105 [Aquisalimonas lutea]|uniref:hypothetical protein n=2 Tax=Pseudomonadota TaxID=1224 RepID=UPI0025B55308|nr:hypothetical protein [Aquisalimonas lutea]MDN3519722.1 hypothetical protein [Aquisalimonas lutea]
MSCIANRCGRVVAAGTGVLLAACATGPKEYESATLSQAQRDHVAAQPPALRSHYQTLYEEGRRNEVLNLMEVGLHAYRNDHFTEARRAFNEARLNIESVYADNEAARRARSRWYEEAEKGFKGEPYERSMVYFYLGLLFLQDGDYGNARASFLGGLLQDAFAEEEQHSADFASLLYLMGWAAQKMGSTQLAEEHFQELQAFRPDAPIPEPRHNVLLVAETGTAPRKLADGVGHYQLVYRRGRGFDDTGAELASGDGWQPLYPIEDVFFQASTRGGRAIDRIVEGQVEFKSDTAEVGANLSDISRNNTLAGLSAAGGGVLAAGYATVTLVSVAAQGLSASSNVRADTRYWESLPDTLHILPLQVAPGEELTVRFVDDNGTPVGAAMEAAVHFDDQGNGLAYISSRQDN